MKSEQGDDNDATCGRIGDLRIHSSRTLPPTPESPSILVRHILVILNIIMIITPIIIKRDLEIVLNGVRKAYIKALS